LKSRIHLNMLNVAVAKLAIPFIFRGMSVWFMAEGFVLSVRIGRVWNSTKYGVPCLQSSSVHLHDHALTSLQSFSYLLLSSGYSPRQGNPCILITMSIKSKHCILFWVNWHVLNLRTPFLYNPFWSLQRSWNELTANYTFFPISFIQCKEHTPPLPDVSHTHTHTHTHTYTHTHTHTQN
jgi:hypothetical protein